jgi:diguanylate cyclase (GGDEF)-like protein
LNVTSDQTSMADKTSVVLARSPRHTIFVRRALVFAIATHGLFAVLFITLQIWSLVWAGACCVACFATCLRLSKVPHVASAYRWAIPICLVGYAAMAAVVVGYHAGFQFYIWILPPLAAVNPYTKSVIKAIRCGLYITLAVSYELWTTMDPTGANGQGLVSLPLTTLHTMRGFNLLAYLALLAGVAYAHALSADEAQGRLHKHAMTDELTGLHNRRHLQEQATHVMERTKRLTNPLCVVLMDIDHFKAINDRHGHPCGDQAIVHVSRLIRDHVRPRDMVARWGGEEFLALLPDIAENDARVAAERWRQLLADTPVGYGELWLPITASFGVAQWQPGETFEHCIARADAALYAAKQAGRNQVKCASAPLKEQAVDALLTQPPATTAPQADRTQAMSSAAYAQNK